ncbi:SIR2 family protein [Leptospira noguchii]|uniref:SIR2 family protein n=1 Tax=Leptospira noguchii TaxID=28182 RepID=UPI000773FB26|nr:SIR2 family protein [Leptospira noguchii]
MSRYKDIIFLLGAGASAEAGIPMSQAMVEKIEEDLQQKENWKKFYKLYNHIKSGIHYSAGLKGKFNKDILYNIENLVSVLYELERNEEHPLYPFIASMNSRLLSLAGEEFQFVREFRKLILERLKLWMSPEDSSRADYYKGLQQLQRSLMYPLHIFSLNYDLCVEHLSNPNFRIESGFESVGPNFPWDWERFEEGETGPEPPQIYLYKLHGSINWKRDQNTKQLYCVDQIASIESENMELIFGRDFKVEAADPYLFYLYAFRAATLNAKLIIAVGYGFGDGHINDMLAQALRTDRTRKILLIDYIQDQNVNMSLNKKNQQLLNAEEEQIIIENKGASAFFLKDELASFVKSLLPKDPNSPF